MSPHLTIRPTRYRRRQGFLVSGRDAHGASVKMFAETREVAERLKGRALRGEPTTLADFTAPTAPRLGRPPRASVCVQLTAPVLAEVKAEAAQREMSVSALIEEAYSVWKHALTAERALSVEMGRRITKGDDDA